MWRRVEAQACAERIEFADIGRDPAPFHFVLRRRLLDQAIADPTARLRHSASQLILERGKHTFRKDETVNNCSAHDTERDLFDARHRSVEDCAGRKHAGKPDQSRSITRQYEHVGPWCTVKQRNEDAERHPKNNGERREFGRVDQIGNDGDHDRTADKGAYNAINRLRAQRAGQRLAGQIDSDHRPARTLQIQAEGNEQREDGRDIAIDGKYDRPNVHAFDHIMPLSDIR